MSTSTSWTRSSSNNVVRHERPQDQRSAALACGIRGESDQGCPSAVPVTVGQGSQLIARWLKMSADKTAPWCPKCGIEYPAGEKTGHCGACHQTFYGLQAFESHRQGPHGTPERQCVDPALVGELWWQDDKDRWHFGERLTSEQKATLWGGRAA